MPKMAGLEKLTRELKEAQTALAELDGDLGSVNFDPDDPLSIEAAIGAMEQMIDQKLGHYAGNSIVAPLAEEMKEKYREAILDKAAEARLSDGDD